jgi:hypothetical protein
LEENAADPIVASAILTAALFLLVLSDAELEMVKLRDEKHVARIADARAVTGGAGVARMLRTAPPCL